MIAPTMMDPRMSRGCPRGRSSARRSTTRRHSAPTNPSTTKTKTLRIRISPSIHARFTMSATQTLGFSARARTAVPVRDARGRAPVARARAQRVVTTAARDGPVIIGLAADSGCGKSTFMRRMTSLFGGKATPPEGGNPDSNTLISDTTTVLCLDDYHLNDRAGRKESGLTALNLKEQNFGTC